MGTDKLRAIYENHFPLLLGVAVVGGLALVGSAINKTDDLETNLAAIASYQASTLTGERDCPTRANYRVNGTCFDAGPFVAEVFRDEIVSILLVDQDGPIELVRYVGPEYSDHGLKWKHLGPWQKTMPKAVASLAQRLRKDGAKTADEVAYVAEQATLKRALAAHERATKKS